MARTPHVALAEPLRAGPTRPHSSPLQTVAPTTRGPGNHVPSASTPPPVSLSLVSPFSLEAHPLRHSQAPCVGVSNPRTRSAWPALVLVQLARSSAAARCGSAMVASAARPPAPKRASQPAPLWLPCHPRAIAARVVGQSLVALPHSLRRAPPWHAPPGHVQSLRAVAPSRCCLAVALSSSLRRRAYVAWVLVVAEVSRQSHLPPCLPMCVMSYAITRARLACAVRASPFERVAIRAL
jgi:hypothetical protein